jgi:hypothetical protein
LTYKVAGWASVSEDPTPSRASPPIWQVVEDWLQSQKGGHVQPLCSNRPKLVGVQGNAGIGSDDTDAVCALPHNV